MHDWIDEALIKASIERAARWQVRANRLLTPDEHKQQRQFAKMLDASADKVFLVKLLDQGLRSRHPGRVADQIRFLLETYGTPRFFDPGERLLSRLFRYVGHHFSAWAVPAIIASMRKLSRQMIIPGEMDELTDFLGRRRAEGVQVNINHLGEAVLGEQEARRRLAVYLDDLKNPLVEHISVKISTLYSQLRPIAFEHDVAVLIDRLSLLYRAAQQQAFEGADGVRRPKIVHLDMEAFDDVETTLAAFRRTLAQDQFRSLTAGIVLQAYLPESFVFQQALTRWARERTAAGGAPIRLRIVKGANLEMERVQAALHGWPQAPFSYKGDVDAHFKRMLGYALQPEHLASVHLGVASHNLFELALAYEAAKRKGVQDQVAFELLAGMADHVRRALAEQGLSLLLYAPVAGRDEFLHAVAYLIRRMDENSGRGNYLRYAPMLTTDSEAWQGLSTAFVSACRRIDTTRTHPFRNQDRLAEARMTPPADPGDEGFFNVPDTDWSLAANRQWADQIRTQWQRRAGDDPVVVTPVVAGQAVAHAPDQAVFDLNQLPDKVVVARFAMADEKDIQRAVATAQADPDGWRARSLSQRHSVLRRAAQAIGRARGDLMGAAAAETGKVFTQSDPEVSEAIDFTNYYPYSMRAFDNSAHLRVRGKGVGVVVSPWNFPIAIPCGGIAAALAAGNTVILKPASSAVLTAWLLCQCFWEAGVSRHTLQFLPCLGVAAGRQLIPHPGVDFVILTGGTETARSMLAQRSDLALSAETGGKNSTIVTAMADRDQAIAHVIASAFGHGGQKCSATSLLILEGEVYDDSYFKSALVDAAQSMAVGSAWRFHNRIGPLIRPPDGVLRRGLTTLAPGETWALAPRNLDNNPHLWTPGIKWGVRSGSFTHTTELFGPVLGVMRADHLDHAVRLANRTGYGLTAGLQSLDPREIDRWADTILAGNLYVNRGTTGAVVLRQPFGGWRRSAVGPAIKAGGPNYVSQFFQVTEIAPPPADKIPRAEPLLDLAQRWEQQCRWGQMASFRDDITRVACALRSYLHHARTLFDVAVDPFHLRGEANHLRHVPVGAVAICVHPNDTHFEVLARLAAAGIAGCRVWLSLPEGLTNGVTQFLDGVEGGLLLTQLKLERCRASEVTQWISRVDRLRYAAADRVPIEVFDAARQGGLHVASAPVLMDGRLELPHYYLNQTVTNAYHRSGNLGDRAGERLD